MSYVILACLLLILSLFVRQFGQEAFTVGTTVGKDELSIPTELTTLKIDDLNGLQQAGFFWKDIDMTRLQELLRILDSARLRDVIDKDETYLRGLTETNRRDRGKELVDLFQAKFYDDYHELLDKYAAIDEVTKAPFALNNATIQERQTYYENIDPTMYKGLEQEVQRLKDELLRVNKVGTLTFSPFLNAVLSYTILSTFYKSGFKMVGNKTSTKTHDIYYVLTINRANFVQEYKAAILRILQKKLLQQSANIQTNAFELAKTNALAIQPEASLPIFATLMEKLNVLEKKELAPILTNTRIDQLAVDRYLEPSCKEGESLFCSGKITCTDIYGNEIKDLMRQESTSYTGGKTYSQCGSYTNRMEYKDWITSFSKDLLGPAKELITYDISNCTIGQPWKINTSCYLSVEKAQEDFLQNHTAKNELLLNSTVLIEAPFLEDLFASKPESIFNLNHPTENIEVQRLKYKVQSQEDPSKTAKYKGNMALGEANQDIATLKKLPKVWVNQVTYYKGKITQINKDGYDLVIPDDYGIKVAGIKKENLFMPNVSYLNVLNETLTDAAVNSLPRPMCSGSFSKCTKTPKIEYDPTDTQKKNLINQYEKAAPYLMTSAEVTDNCPATSPGFSTGLGFSIF